MSAEGQRRDGNLIVVAGAGTGKTHHLVETCLRRVNEGAGIDEILIVTFTRAAAAELRQRIGAALQKALEAEPGSAHLARQIALLDRAQISTLHSFCLELVSRHFAELGLSPRLTTLEAAQSAILQTEALDALFGWYYEGKSERALEAQEVLLDWFRGDEGAARQLALKLHSFTQTRPNPERWFAEQRARLSGEEPTLWRQWMRRGIEEWAQRWRPVIQAQPSEKNPARGLVLGLIDKRKIAEVAALNVKGTSPVWPRGTKKKFLAPVKKMYEEAAQWAEWSAAGTGDPLLEDWNLTRGVALEALRMAEEFRDEYARIKRERGLVDFHDLEQFALRLLWNEKGEASVIAEAWRRKFEWIFVDEYQDINAAQDAILRALGREDGEGNRFLVGDVKQSIYGFRQAEPSIFLRYEANWKHGQGGARRHLSENWRSHERILDFVNGLFGALMSESVGGVAYDEAARLRFAAPAERRELTAAGDSTPRVEVHFINALADGEGNGDAGEGEEGELNSLADFVRAEAEAEVLAGLCRRMVKENPVVLPTRKAAEYGDIVILMRSAQTEAEAFAKVFHRRGIPLEARRTGFFGSIEVLDLKNLLTILDNPLQDIPLLGLLRSPFGGFSIEDLAAMRIALPKGPLWEAFLAFERLKGEGPKKARRFLRQYQDWRDLARCASLSRRLERILEETGYEEWAAAQDRGAQRRATVRRFVDLARQFDAMRGEGLYPFLQYVQDQEEAAAESAPAGGDSHGAVRLMTVHQSKGLQFPIVMLAGLGKAFDKRDFNGAFLVDEEFGLCLKARPPGARRQYETTPFHMAKRKLEKRSLDEEMRILYVALTRAQHRLILAAEVKKNAIEKWEEGGKRLDDAGSMLDWIGPWLAGQESRFLTARAGEAGDWLWAWHASAADWEAEPSGATEAGLTAETKKALRELKRRLNWIYPNKDATRQEAKSSATALRRALADEPELARQIGNPGRKFSGASVKSRLGASEIGLAAHRFLQHANFETFGSEEALRKEMERLCAAGLLSAEEGDAIDLARIQRFWSTHLGRALLERREFLTRELVFTARFSREDLRNVGAPGVLEFGADEFIVVQGAADLAAVLPEELWLVDFKTDRAPDVAIEPRLKEYSLQLRIYALALGRIYSRPVKAWLYFLETGRLEPVETGAGVEP